MNIMNISNFRLTSDRKVSFLSKSGKKFFKKLEIKQNGGNFSENLKR